MKDGGNYERIEDDIVNRKGLQLIAYNRPGKRRGGGVCIVIDPRKLKMEEHKFKRSSFEIVAAKGKIISDKRPIIVYCIYLPPNLTAIKAREAAGLINEDISKQKTLLNNPSYLDCGRY